jgi:hypothetical protein
MNWDKNLHFHQHSNQMLIGFICKHFIIQYKINGKILNTNRYSYNTYKKIRYCNVWHARTPWLEAPILCEAVLPVSHMTCNGSNGKLLALYPGDRSRLLVPIAASNQKLLFAPSPGLCIFFLSENHGPFGYGPKRVTFLIKESTML